jgi:hypothetical protein
MKGLEKFKPHEKQILNQFVRSLPEKSKLVFARQIGCVGVVQRLANGFDVNMYSKGIFSAKPLNCERFEDMPDELLAATFRPVAANSKLDVAKLWFVRGRPFAIEFGGSGSWDAETEWVCDLEYPFS